jgi:hypothetical protein
MTEATDKLAKSRLAIYECVARRERRHDPREETAYGFESGAGYPDEEPPPGGGWFGHLSHAVRTWWRYHPAHMAVDLAAPLARSYARRKPWQLVGISFATGAALTFARPWRLISLTTLAVAVLKSSQLSNLLMAAMSAADYRHDGNRPG